MKILIYNGISIEIDADDFDKIEAKKKPGCNWYYDAINKVVKAWCIHNNVVCKLPMHRVIMDCYSENFDVDHVKHNPFDLRKESLRICSHQENCFNQKGKYKGVARKRNKFVARIRTKEGRKYLGVFASYVDASIAYNEAAFKYHGEFACFNIFPFVVSL